MKKIIVFFIFAFLFFGCINLDVGTQDQNESKNGNGGQGNGLEGSIEIGNGSSGTVSGHDDDVIYRNGSYIYDPDSLLAVYFIDLDVKYLQGDSILVKKGGYDLLVDTGSVESEKGVVDFLKGKVSGDLEVVILSHDDPAYWGGMQGVLDNFNVKEVWWSGDVYSDGYAGLIKTIKDKGIALREIERGDKKEINGGYIEILNPSKTKFKNPDSDSIASKISFGQVCVLLLSDMIYGSQTDMINYYGNKLECQAMQVPFNGLGTGNTNLNLLLKFVKPRYAVITGDDDIENPSNDVLREPTYQQLQWENVTVYKSWEGTVGITTDGNNLNINYK